MTLSRTTHLSLEKPPDAREVTHIETTYRISDSTEQVDYTFHTDGSIHGSELPDSPFPVEDAVTITTDELHIPSLESLFVRSPEGEMISQVGENQCFKPETEASDVESFILDLNQIIKTYIFINTHQFTIRTDLDNIHIELSNTTELTLAVRSYHQHPAQTITTTSDIENQCHTISALASSIKTWSPERSFPTLRGHPARVELGQELSIPSGMSIPDTGITFKIPPTYDALYPLAPLAYYLGAEIQPTASTQDSPQLTTSSGFTYNFPYPTGYASTLQQIFRQIFILDCATRTVGLYEVSLDERDVIEDSLPQDSMPDWESLYDSSLETRIENYLEIPYSSISDAIPTWDNLIYVPAESQSIEFLPYLLHRLSLIDTTNPELCCSETVTETDSLYYQNVDFPTYPIPDSRQRPEGNGNSGSKQTYYVELPQTDHAHHLSWTGDGVPLGGNKIIPEGFEHQLDVNISFDSISLCVIINDDEMYEEGNHVQQHYGSRDTVPFDTAIKTNLTTQELESELQNDWDFVHYIGHAEDPGLRCDDGICNIESLPSVNIKSFFLNACKSYSTGVSLVEKGAVGGVVTLTEIPNEAAVPMGVMLARLLNHGFPLHEAQSVAKREIFPSAQYTAVGNPTMSIAKSTSRISASLHIVDIDENHISFALNSRPNETSQIGSMSTMQTEAVDHYYIAAGDYHGPYTVPHDEFNQLVDLDDACLLINGDVYWSDSISIPEIQEIFETSIINTW